MAELLLTALHNAGSDCSAIGAFIDYPVAIDPAYAPVGNPSQYMLGVGQNTVPERSTIVMTALDGRVFTGSGLR